VTELARITEAEPMGGFAVRLTFTDGLVWRSKAYRSIDEARAAYENQGLYLGLS